MKFYPLSGIHLPDGYTRQIWRTMKLTFILLTAFFLQVSAATLAQQVTLKTDRITLKKAFTEIRKQTGYIVLCQANEVDLNKTVSLNLDHVSLKEAMTKILENQNLDFTIEDQSIVIKKKEAIPNQPQVQPSTNAPPVTVTGKVANELGEPMAGVTVKQKSNPGNGTVTDAKGNYTISVPDDKTVIVFSYVGYESKELRARDIPTGSAIILKIAENNLREVVINKGYYSEKQELSTSDVSVVTAKQIEEQPVSDPIEALKARVPGLYIQQNSGLPGSYAQIEIRGQNSIANGNDPLYVVDGVPFNSVSLNDNVLPSALGAAPNRTSNQVGNGGLSNGYVSNSGTGMSPFNSLNPNDIESIEVLKDADATAIYGARGANGVILITTKKGEAGDTRVDVNVQSGVSTVAREMDLLNTQQYLEMREEAFKNDGLAVPSIQTTPSDYNYDIDGVWDQTRYTNWQKVLIGNKDNFTNAQVELSGGNANTQFRIGLGFNDQGTVFPGDFSNKRASGSFNLTHASNDQRFHAQFTGGYSYDDNNLPTSDLTYTALVTAPDAPAVYNPDGSLNWQLLNGSATWNNPLAYTLETANATTYSFNSDLVLSYRLWKGLEIKSTFGYNRTEMDQTDIIPSTAYSPQYSTIQSLRSYYSGTGTTQTWNIEPQLNYHTKIAKGELNILGGATLEQDSRSDFSFGAQGFATDAQIVNPLSATTKSIINDNYSQYRFNSLYGRIGYTWDDKYLLNITVRRDGSSRFGPGKEFGDFGAVGAGWVFSKEKFISDNLSWLNFGKLRVSYGTSGNDQIPDYQYLSTYSTVSSTYQGVTGLLPKQLSNPYFAWELDKKLEGGLDLGFLQDRVDLSASYFRNRTSNQLVQYPLPTITGFGSIQYNLPAVVQNTGAEFNLHTVNIKANDFSWSSSFNMTIPQNKLLSYPNLASSPYAYSYRVGQPLSILIGYHYTGVNPQTGLYTFQTNSTDGLSLTRQDMNTVIPVIQRFYGGFQNSFRYKKIQLDFMFQFVKQTKQNYYAFWEAPAGYVYYNQPTYVLGRWQSPGSNSNIGRFETGNTAPYANDFYDLESSDRAVSDASFIRLQNLSLSYQLPETWLHVLHLKSARFYVQGQNLLTITSYLGLDPESGGANLPPLRTITGGVQASL